MKVHGHVMFRSSVQGLGCCRCIRCGVWLSMYCTATSDPRYFHVQAGLCVGLWFMYKGLLALSLVKELRTSLHWGWDG